MPTDRRYFTKSCSTLKRRIANFIIDLRGKKWGKLKKKQEDIVIDAGANIGITLFQPRRLSDNRGRYMLLNLRLKHMFLEET